MGIIEWLQGKKTYILIIVGAIFNIGVAAGLWTPESGWWEIINSILIFLGIGALGAKGNRMLKSK